MGIVARFVCFAVSVLLLGMQDGHAFLREIEPGKEVRLDTNEGLLLVSVDTLAEIDYVRVQKEGNIFSSAKLKDLKPGVTTKLYAAPAGKYRWDRIGLFANYYYELSDDAEFKFEIRAGVVNYPGDLLFRHGRGSSGRMRPVNRALQAMDWLETQFPSLTSMKFVYLGHYADPFIEHYRKLRAAHPDKKLADLDKLNELPPPLTPPLPIEELWQTGRIAWVSVNPSGDLLAEAVYEKEKWGIDLIDLRASEVRRLVNPPFRVESMQWFGNRSLVASLGEPGDKNFIAAFHVDSAVGKPLSAKNVNLPYTGRVVGGSLLDSRRILIASTSPGGKPMVHPVNMSSEASVKNSDRSFDTRLNKGLADDYLWYADAAGNVRAVLAMIGKQIGLFYGQSGNYQELIRFKEGEEPYFVPAQVSPNGDLIYGFSDYGRNQRDLVVFDPSTKTIAQTLFSKDGADIQSAIFNRAGMPIGARYYDSGNLVSGYFDEADRRLNALIEKAFPDKTAVVLSRDDEGKVAILGVDGSDFPFSVYQLNTETRRASLLDESTPSLSKKKWTPSVVVHARGADGQSIEAYLTLPSSAGKRPLIVLAHGGPIGIRDERHFDPEVQFLAGLGYAVLQVNFRGSEGYGRAYREAAKGGYGTLIEDDIDSAVDAALASYPLDAGRMCAMGTSYGGYSALMSAVRHPDRFRCVVSISGVSDRILSFTASDSAFNAARRKALEKYIGNPNDGSEALMRTSPIYRLDGLKAPVLIVHGTEDERVDYENARRLVRMLNLAGRPPSLIRLQGEGHGIRDMKNRAQTYPLIAAFLSRHLSTAAPQAGEEKRSSPELAH